MKKITVFIFILTFALLDNVYSQDNKTVTITVTGDGITQNDALQSALRNAIEQAFGTFISSNTQILNDELIKDEIVSISNGNIQAYNIISEIQTSAQNWNTTVKATVSVDKLTSFCESKGVNVEFKGSLFALNIKQQNLNEENEKSAIKNMCKVLKNISDKSFDYQISAGEPISLGSNNKWGIPITITATTNTNFKIMSDYLFVTLTGLSLSPEEVSNYTKLGKSYQTIVSCPLGYEPPVRNKKGKIIKSSIKPPALIYLRNSESLIALKDFIEFFRKSLLNFAVINEIKIEQGEDIHNNHFLELKSSNFHPVYSNLKYGDRKYEVYNRETYYYYNSESFLNPIRYNSYFKLKELDFDNPESTNSKFFPFLAEIDDNSVLGEFSQIDLAISFWLFKKGYTAAVLEYSDYLTLDQLSKISGYKIIPRIGGSETDQDGKMFETTYIGSQRWMSQDLNVAHFSNGDPIEEISKRELEKWRDSKNAAYTCSSNDSDYNLYNWYTIIDSRNVCPSGWHVPSKAEWEILVDFLGGTEIAGGKLKGIKYKNSGYYMWENPNDNDKNEFNFSANSSYFMDGLGIKYLNVAKYWVKTDVDSSHIHKSATIYNDNSKLVIGSEDVDSGLKIRCIKD